MTDKEKLIRVNELMQPFRKYLRLMDEAPGLEHKPMKLQKNLHAAVGCSDQMYKNMDELNDLLPVRPAGFKKC